MTMRRLLLTTPIFYVNGAPHIGHAYTGVLSDFYARATRVARREKERERVWLTSGTDEHGFKVARAAAAAHESPQALCDRVSRTFRDAFARLDVLPDQFVRTTQPQHARVVAALWRRLQRRGFLSLSVYRGWYCVSDEAFVPPDSVVLGPDPADRSRTVHLSRDSGNVVERIDEPTYMFDLPRLRDAVRAWLLSTPPPVLPAERLHEALAMLDSPVAAAPLSVSRPRTRVAWGLPVPGDAQHTIYVWLDALANYLTVLAPDGDDDAVVRALDDDHDDLSALGWPAHLQVIGKDILRFHAIFWPAFLIAAGIRPPRELLVHAWWTTAGEKLSKSRGNVTLTLDALLERYEPDALRYFLLRHGGLANDAELSETLLSQCRNAELVDRLGNLLSRLTAPSMLPEQCWPAPCAEATVVHRALTDAAESVSVAVNARRAGEALEAVSSLLRVVNTFVAQEQPWAMTDAPRKAHTLRASLDGLEAALLLLQPAMPSSCERALTFLGVDDRSWLRRWDARDAPHAPRFGAAKAPALFPRHRQQRDVEVHRNK